MLAFSTLFGLFALSSVALGKSASFLPSFSWDQRPSPHGVQLLKVSFPDGGADDFAVLKPYNPIPKAPLEREEDVDSCIFEGSLLEEEESIVTVTGCPHSEKFQVLLHSKRSKSTMFEVEGGKTREVQSHSGSLQTDYFQMQGAAFTDAPLKSNRQLSPTGYILKLKLNYDDNWKDKFGGEYLNTIRRVVAFAQNIWKWPSAAAKLYFLVDPEVRYLPGRWTASNSSVLVCQNNLESVHVNAYLTVRSAKSGSAMGVGYLGGACVEEINYKCCVQEWNSNDIVTSRVLAHEIGHTVGQQHDFSQNNQPRFDSKGKPCTNVGGIMDYAAANEDDKSLWSNCSVEDFKKLMATNSSCMEPATASNTPPATPPVLTATECKMPPALANLNGVHNLFLNGVASLALCVNGVCAPIGGTPEEQLKGCVGICGKESCLDATAS